MSEQFYSCDNRLLREIANPHLKRRDVARTYRYALLSGEAVDWETVHQSIIKRWSYFAVEWIRREANKPAVAKESEKNNG